MSKRPHVGSLLILFSLFATACTVAVGPADSQPERVLPSAEEINEAAERKTSKDKPTIDEMIESSVDDNSAIPLDDTGETPDSGDPRINRRVPVPEGLRVNWLLGFDSIRPVYDPEYAPAGEAPLDDRELVIGVAWDGEAKAYPITVLRTREMVNDDLAGIPTLVTW